MVEVIDPLNRNIHGNASNLEKLARSGPSHEENARNIGNNEDAVDCINLLVTAAAQMATMLTQINKMPIPPTVQQLRGEIPRMETSHHNETPSRG